MKHINKLLCICCLLFACLPLAAQTAATGSKQGKAPKGVSEAWKQAVAFPKRKEIVEAIAEFKEATECPVIVNSHLQNSEAKKKSLGQKLVETIFGMATPQDINNAARVEVLWSEQTAPLTYSPNMQGYTHMVKQGLFLQEAMDEFANNLSKYKETAPQIKDSKADLHLIAALEQLKQRLNTKGMIVQLYNGDKLCGRNSIVEITKEPAMPALRVKPIKANFSTDAKIETRLEIAYNRDGMLTATPPLPDVRNDFVKFPAQGWQSLPVTEEWKVDFEGKFYGGTALLISRYGERIDTFTFYIRGGNPDDKTVIASLEPHKGKYWFITRVNRQESQLHQFGGAKLVETTSKQKLKGFANAKGEPTYGYPRGFGLKQLDNWDNGPATHQHLWNWKENIVGGIEVVKEKEKKVKGWQGEDLKNLEEWNRPNKSNPVSDTLTYIDNNGNTVTALFVPEGEGKICCKNC
jgi:hypothetical protein